MEGNARLEYVRDLRREGGCQADRAISINRLLSSEVNLRNDKFYHAAPRFADINCTGFNILFLAESAGFELLDRFIQMVDKGK